MTRKRQKNKSFDEMWEECQEPSLTPEPIADAVVDASDIVEKKLVADIIHFSKDAGCFQCEGQANNAIDLYMGEEMDDCTRSEIRQWYREGGKERG